MTHLRLKLLKLLLLLRLVRLDLLGSLAPCVFELLHSVYDNRQTERTVPLIKDVSTHTVWPFGRPLRPPFRLRGGFGYLASWRPVVSTRRRANCEGLLTIVLVLDG
jgi:hypothetical protein